MTRSHRSRSKLSTTAWTETSSAAVGSSRMTRSGLSAIARAMPTRAFCPPESWCGNRSSRSSGRPTWRASSSQRARTAPLPLSPPSRRIGSAIARAAVKRGLRLSVGSWNTIWMRLRSGSLANRLAGISPMFSPSNMMVPSLLSIRRITMVEVVDLPQPDSPTRPTLSPRSTVKLMPSTARKISGSGAGPCLNSLLSVLGMPLRGYSLISFSTTSSGSLCAPLPFTAARVGAAAAALASEASGQRGDSMVRAHSASEDARKRADDTRPEPGSSARAALASEASGQRGNSIVRAPDTRPEPDSTARDVVMPARTILVAAGTQPNTVLGREAPQHLAIDGKYFQAFDEEGRKVTPERITKPAAAHVLMSLAPDGRAISFFGDLHPSFAGNVVKAMASAKQGYPVVSRMLARQPPSAVSTSELVARLDDELRATVHEVNRLTPTIVEVVVRAPMAARAFKPGQFYRLQNYETLAHTADGTRLAKEGLALTGASVDRDRGLLSTIVLEMGGSSDLCAQLAPGEPVVLMGPTGHPTETPSGETVLLIGGGLGNAVLFSIGQALRRNGSRVIYFAGYKRAIDRYKVAEIERAGDAIVWCCDQAPGFRPERPQDRAFVGNIVAALDAYGSGALGDAAIPLGDVDRVIAIGSDGMMAAVARARQGILAQHLKPGHKAIASINSPMQCMMKEICAQCLQVQRDPETGVERVVFSCFNQDQDLDHVDFDNLRARLGQNGVQEKLTRLWIDRSLRQLGLRQTAAE